VKTLIIGLGNPYLGDDGVGCVIADRVCERLANQVRASENDFEIDNLSVGGLRLMERMIDYDQVIIIDAITTGKHPEGEVITFPVDQLPVYAQGHLGSAHDTSLQNALQMGRTLGVDLPAQIDIVGIEARHVYDFSEDLSPAVAAAVPKAVETVMEILNQQE
jgi:hydrogenase maturation protease